MKIAGPERLHAAFAEAYNSGSLENLVSLYEPDAILIPQPGEQAAGLPAIQEAFTNLLKLKGTMQITTLLCLRSGDIALLQASWCLSGIGSNGEPLDSSGRTAEVARRQADGSWLFVLDNAFADF